MCLSSAELNRHIRSAGRYNDFRETMRQRVAFKDYPHLTLKSYHTCDGSRDRDNSCNVIRGSAHTVAEVAASGPASGDTVALRERVAEINVRIARKLLPPLNMEADS